MTCELPNMQELKYSKYNEEQEPGIEEFKLEFSNLCTLYGVKLSGIRNTMSKISKSNGYYEFLSYDENTGVYR